MKKTWQKMIKVVVINLMVCYSIVRWQDDLTGMLSLLILPFSLMLLNREIVCEERQQDDLED